MGLVVELQNKNNGQYESIRNNVPHILLPSKNALCKVINNNNLPLQTFFSTSSKTSRAIVLKKIAELMLVRSKGKMLKNPVKQNVVVVMKIDEIHTSAKRFFLSM